MMQSMYKTDARGSSRPACCVRLHRAHLLTIGCVSGLSIALAVYQWCVG